jgi:predicted RNA-binding protein with PIN domain
MNSGELMVVLIVAIVMIASIVKHRTKQHPVEGNGETRIENQRLREEVQELKERLKVLERITVDKENSLAKEIESLRDR